MADYPIVYTFRRCPYAIRARLALNYAGVIYEHREVVLRDKPDEMLACSSKGTVPVLVTGTEIIDESFDIMLWALRLQDPDLWLDAANQYLIDYCENEFKPALDNYKYADHRPDSTEDYWHECQRVLRPLEEVLSEQSSLSGAQQWQLTDWAIAPFIRQFAAVDRTKFESECSHELIAWHKQFVESQLLASVMPKYAQWSPGDVPLIIGPR